MKEVQITTYDFEIGSQVFCEDGKCGKLRKIVIDPESKQVNELIVEKGLLFK